MTFSSVRFQKWERTVTCSIILAYLAHMMRACFCVWCAKCAKYLAFGTFERADDSALNSSFMHYFKLQKFKFIWLVDDMTIDL